MKKLAFLTLFLFIGVFVVNAQEKFVKFHEQDSVVFYYKWKPEVKNSAESPLLLVVKIENKKNNRNEVDFVMDYYYETIRKASSEKQTFCVAAKKALIKDVKKTKFDGADLTNEQLLSDKFVIELSEVSIKKVDKCKK